MLGLRLPFARGGEPRQPGAGEAFRGRVRERAIRAWSRVSDRGNAAVTKLRAEIETRLQLANEIVSPLPAHQALSATPRSLKTHVALVFGISAGINLLYLAPSLYMLQVYDRVLATGGIVTLLLLTFILIMSLVVLAVLEATRARLLSRAALRVERLTGDAVIEAAMKARRTGQPSEATPRDLDNLRSAISSPAAAGILDIPWTPLFIIVCFLIHFWIGVLSVVGAAVIFALALANERATRSAIADTSRLASRFYGAHETDLSSAETIFALGAQKRIHARRAGARNDFVRVQTITALQGGDFSAATKITRMFLQSAALGLGAFLAVERQISPGAIIAATILTARAFAPVEQVVGGWRQIGLGYQSFKSLRRMLQGVGAEAHHIELPDPEGRLDVEGVTALAPDGRTIALQNASFSVAPGEIVGVVGPSGAGKTTLARVLANAAQPRGGAVRLDGARYTEWGDEALAQHIGYLPQRIDLFDGTVAQNISCFAPEADRDGASVGARIVAAAKQAGAHEMILRLPKGYETELGPLGAGLSPGQAQRIALARALFDEPRLVVLDEPNSHLDQEGEAALAAAIQAVRARNGVVVIIAHRAGIINVADQLLVLRDGRVLEYGPRAAIMAKLQGVQAAGPRQ